MERTEKRRPITTLFTLLALIIVGSVALFWRIYGSIRQSLLSLKEDRTSDIRTFRVDAVVGHGDSLVSPSHFIVFEQDGHVTITEYPAGNPVHAMTYDIPDTIDDRDTTIKLSFNGLRHIEKPDMFVMIGTRSFVLYNTGTRFLLQRDPSPII